MRKWPGPRPAPGPADGGSSWRCAAMATAREAAARSVQAGRHMSPAAARQYIWAQLADRDTEAFAMLCLNSQMELLDSCEPFHGTLDHPRLPRRAFSENSRLSEISYSQADRTSTSAPVAVVVLARKRIHFWTSSAMSMRNALWTMHMGQMNVGTQARSDTEDC